MNSDGDKPLSRWQDAFVPMRLAQSLTETTLSNGQPLVIKEQFLLPHKVGVPPNEMPDWSIQATLAGLILAGLFFAASYKPKLFNFLCISFWVLSGLLGSFMLYIWMNTEHYFVHGNENILLFSPFAWLSLILFFMRNKSPLWLKAFKISVKFLAASAALAVLIKLFPFGDQNNSHWLLMLLPVQWVIVRQINKMSIKEIACA
jgi:hypothetical protein